MQKKDKDKARNITEYSEPIARLGSETRTRDKNKILHTHTFMKKISNKI